MKPLLSALLLISPACFAGEVSILEVSVECTSSCTFSVTLEHADEGWNHYANQWDVVTLDGKVLKSRVLYPSTCGRFFVKAKDHSVGLLCRVILQTFTPPTKRSCKRSPTTSP